MPTRIRPRNIADIESYIRSLFLLTEQKLIREIARKRNSNFVDYAEVAALKRVQGTLQSLQDECFKYVPVMIEEHFYNTWKDYSGYANAENIGSTALSSGQIKAIELLTNNLLGEVIEAVKQTETSAVELINDIAIGRLTNDPLRSYVLQQTLSNIASGKGSLTDFTRLTTALETKGITAFVDKAGRHWSLRDYGTMAVRTTMRQATNAAILTADDHDLWQISKIGTTCPICAPLEGRVYSKSGTNSNYPSLAVAFGKIDPYGSDDLSNTYLNTHPNCRHSLYKFTEADKTDAELQKIRDFSDTTKNPLNHDPRSKKQIAAYKEKVKQRQKYLRELRKKQATRLSKSAEFKLNDNEQYYKPVEIDENIKEIFSRNKSIVAHKVKNSQYDMYISDNLKVKPKEMNFAKQQISKSFKLLGDVEGEKPKFVFIADAEMSTGAAASYNFKNNIVYLREQALSKTAVLSMQDEFAVSNNPASTYIHELIHWADKKHYDKLGITSDYREWIVNYSKQRLDKLGVTEYNVRKISKYAKDMYTRKLYDEVFTEYRVKQLLKGE